MNVNEKKQKETKHYNLNSSRKEKGKESEQIKPYLWFLIVLLQLLP